MVTIPSFKKIAVVAIVLGFGSVAAPASAATFSGSSNLNSPSNFSAPPSLGTPSNSVAFAAAVPTPALLPGLIGMGMAAWRRRKVEALTEDV